MPRLKTPGSAQTPEIRRKLYHNTYFEQQYINKYLDDVLKLLEPDGTKIIIGVVDNLVTGRMLLFKTGSHGLLIT